MHSCHYGSDKSHKRNLVACFRNKPLKLEFLSSTKKVLFQCILKVYCNIFDKLIFDITCIDKIIARKFFFFALKIFLLIFINMQATQLK